MARRGRGEGTVYRRADGRWEAALGVGGRRQRYVGQSQREVRVKLLAARRALEQGIVLSGSSQRVEEYLTRWLEDSVRPSVRWTTHRAYSLCMRRLSPLIGHLRLTALTPQAVQAAYAALLQKGLSRRSVEQTHTVLHRALRQAVLWGLMSQSYRGGDRPTTDAPGDAQLTEEEVGRLFEASRGDRLHALWVLLATTGLRLGEARGLLWSDIDFASGRLVVNRALQRQTRLGYVFVEPKTPRSRRTVYLAPGTINTLTDHRRRQVEDQLGSGPEWDNTGLVFTTAVGRPADGTWVTKWFHRALDQGGLPRVRIHDLRPTAATHLLRRGVHPKVVQELLGHSTISLTLDTLQPRRSRVARGSGNSHAGAIQVTCRAVDHTSPRAKWEARQDPRTKSQ
jgi:integrase